MALQPQNVPISFSLGLDTKTDDKQVIPGKMLTLNNASFSTLKEIKKRDGTTAIPASILGGGSISKGVGVSNYQNELVALDGTNLYSYSKDLGEQINRGPMVPVDLSVTSVIRNSGSQNLPSLAYDSVTGLKCYTWSDSTGGIRYSVVDSTTGSVIVNNALIDSGAPLARTLIIGNYFIISYWQSSGTKLVYRAISTATPTTLGAEVTIATTTFQNFNAALINGSIYFAYKSAISHISLKSLSSGLVLSSAYDVTVAGTVNNITLCGDGSGNVWVFYSTLLSAGTTNGFIVDGALTTVLLAHTAIDSSYGFFTLTASVSGTTATIYYEALAADATNSGNDTSHMIKKNTLTLTGTVGTASIVMRGVGLASKLFTYNSVTYFLVVYAGEYLLNKISTSSSDTVLTSQEPTYFLINGSGQIIMKLAPLNAGQYYLYGVLPEVTAISATKFAFPYLFQDDVSSQNGNIFFNTGVLEATIDFNVSHAPSKLNIANNLLLASGQCWAYDGANIVEQGFHIYPENLSQTFYTSAGGIGSSLNTGTTLNQIQYIALYEWVDNQGQLNRSAPSPALTVQLPAASSLSAVTFTGTTTINTNVISSVTVGAWSNYFVGQIFTDTTNASTFPAGTYITSISQATSTTGTITVNNIATASHAGDTFSTKDVCSVLVNIPCLRQTAKSDVSVVLYRTQNNQTIFYRVSSLTSLTYNDPTSDFVAITDTLPDEAIVGNEQLYTTGGEVDNISPPAISALVSFKNRALYLSPENPFQFGYSKQALPGVPVEFSSLLFNQNVDQKIGRLSAIGTMDDKIIIFGPTNKFYVVGDGPSPNGLNDDFTEAIRIAGTTGCTNQASILELPIGLVYQDPLKGIWLLDRSFQERYIGADVREFNSYQVTSAQLFENSNRAIFTLSNGTNLVYDYYVNQWETDIYASGAVDSCIFENDLIYIQSDGLEFEQTPGVFTDNGSLIPLGFKTGWLSFAGIEGFQRVWELQILGSYKSPHTLNINIYVDFSTTIAETIVIPVLTDPGLYSFRVNLKVQKCQSMQIELTETQSGTIGEGFSLSSMAFRVGVKAGLYNNLPAEKSF